MQDLQLPLLNDDKSQSRWFYAGCAIAALIMIGGILSGLPVFMALPFLLLFMIWVVFRIDIVIYLSILVTPLSLNLSQTGLGIGVSVPSEPIMFGLFLLYWMKVAVDGGLKREIIRHPVTILVLIHMGWFAITTCTSSMPVVSLKSTLARYTYITVYYFALLEMFLRIERIRKMVWLYAIPMMMVIFYTLANQAAAGFTEANAHTAMVPFYNDHTAYASALAFFIPIFIAFAVEKGVSGTTRFWSIAFSVLLTFAVIASYTRAAWIGLAAAIGCYLIFLLRVKAWIVYTGIALVVIGAFAFRVELAMKLEQNNKVSSTDYASHLESMGNISSDDSNVERLNRWACALRMFRQRPWFGFGPGTYMFKYAPFQKDSEKSGISTNAGTAGGSHSEYLGPLSEQGFMGTLIFVALAAVILARTGRFVKQSKNRHHRALAKGLVLGLITYWIHGFLNFFLDTEKASMPFWGFIAALVALDLYANRNSSGDQPAAEQRNIVE